MDNEIKKMIQESTETKNKVNADEIKRSILMLTTSFKKGNKILIAGNGGSLTQASHFQGELIGRFKKERAALPCIALTDLATITALANDYGFDTIFEKQIQALGKKDDVFIGISTSGNSENIIKAIKKAKELGLKTISLLGKDGGKTKGLADIEIVIKSNNTPRIQESHIMILHIICELIEKELFG